MSLLLSLVFLLPAGSGECDSAARCNRLGTEAYQAGDYASAAQRFERQIDYVETTMQRAEEVTEAMLAARDLALNNALLAQLRLGQCLKAQAYLDLARSEARATTANRRQLETRCSDALAAQGPLGEYWQYAGHGLWNRLSLRESGDEHLRLDAFWMRVGPGPLDEFGIAAFGDMEQVFVLPDGETARGRFPGNEPEHECWVELRFESQAVQVSVSEDPACHTGGMGAVLHGHYRLVSTELPDLED